MFQGEWLRTGDTYVQDEDGCYRCLGRTGEIGVRINAWTGDSEVADGASGLLQQIQLPLFDGAEPPVSAPPLLPRAYPRYGRWCRSR